MSLPLPVVDKPEALVRLSLDRTLCHLIHFLKKVLRRYLEMRAHPPQMESNKVPRLNPNTIAAMPLARNESTTEKAQNAQTER